MMEQTHEASGVGLIGANFVVNFNQALLDDRSNFSASQGILQSIAEEHGKRERFAKLMWTRRGTRGLQGIMLAAFFGGRV